MIIQATPVVRVYSILLLAFALCCGSCAHAQSGAWGWINGSNKGLQTGAYGTPGVPSAGIVPASREVPATWTDSSGNFWLFGGEAGASGSNGSIHLNDLWEFTPSSGQWTSWSGSSNTVGGTYGTLGVPAASNIPGARQASVGWSDTVGNMWLFGGWGYDATETFGHLNDLWKFNLASRQWTWMGGSSNLPNANDSCQPGIYGTRGTPSPANIPGGRQLASAWTDKSGNFWLFGGGGCDSSGSQSLLNDLWMFSPATNQWTWISGRSTAGSSLGGVYGLQGTPSVVNTPGNRWTSTSWTDPSGNLWLYAGEGYDGVTARGYLNDLWEFNISTVQWTWVSGSSVIGTANCYQPGVECAQGGAYGTLGQPAATNVPGGRSSPTGWTDSSGNAWIFGGSNNPGSYDLFFNDLWKFNVQTRQWTWMAGSSGQSCALKDNSGNCIFVGTDGAYGTLGVASTGNNPGSRNGAAGWTDANGALWLFAGDGLDAFNNLLPLNDLWQFRFEQATTLRLVSSANPAIAQNAITLTASVTAPSGAPTGTITFLDGAASIGTASLNGSGQASLALTTLAAGSHTLTASYGGDPSNLGAVSSPLTQIIADFSLPAGTSTAATVSPGASATYAFSFNPLGSTTFPGAVTLSASGGPAGTTYAFSPSAIAQNSAATSFNLTANIPTYARLGGPELAPPGDHPWVPLIVAAAMLPLALLRRSRSQRPATTLFLALAGIIAVPCLIGCGSGGGAAPNTAQTYTLTVTASSGALSHSSLVTLTVN